MTRREEEVVNRLRLSHTRLTHDYLFSGQTQRTMCVWCNDAYITVEHLLVTCAELGVIRREMMRTGVGEVTVEKILAEGGDPKVVLNFLARLQIINEI